MKTIIYIAIFTLYGSIATAQVNSAQITPAYDNIILKPHLYVDTSTVSTTMDYVTLSFPEELENATVIVTDMQGKLLLSGNYMQGDSLTLDVSGFEKGAYVISIENKGAVYSGRFTKP